MSPERSVTYVSERTGVLVSSNFRFDPLLRVCDSWGLDNDVLSLDAKMLGGS